MSIMRMQGSHFICSLKSDGKIDKRIDILEIWDIYNENENKTDRTIIRGKKLK